MNRILAGLLALLCVVLVLSVQQARPSQQADPAQSSSSQPSSAQSASAQTAPSPPSAGSSSAEGTSQSAAFMQSADQILQEMSKLLSLPVLTPLKKSLRSREEIRQYLLRKMDEDKDAGKRYADQKTLEKLGLLPKDYPLQDTLVKVLTEQIAGLYDPESQEFFVADWNNPEDEELVMSHELTHALQDQHFHIDQWTDAAKPDDDAELARDAVLEGSAVAAMFEYELRGKASIRDIGDIDPELLMGDPSSSPELASAPKVLQDELLFPYLAGTTFTQHLLKASSGWPDFYKVFANPPRSTQQIMHPDLYLQHVVPPHLKLPDASRLLSSDWKKLDQNDMGEFGIDEVFKQFLDKDRAADLSSAWSADQYAIFENQKDKNTLLEMEIRLTDDSEAARFFGGYSEVLELKYNERSNLLRRPNFFSFDAPDGGVFLRCFNSDCMVLEGGNREMFDRLTQQLHWPPGPVVPIRPGGPAVRQTFVPAGKSIAPAALR